MNSKRISVETNLGIHFVDLHKLVSIEIVRKSGSKTLYEVEFVSIIDGLYVKKRMKPFKSKKGAKKFVSDFIDKYYVQ